MPAEYCELCGKPLAEGEFYMVRIDVFADPALPGVRSKDLEAIDFDREIDRLLDRMEDMTADELQDQVHRRFEYRICAACQPRLLADPLGKTSRAGARRSTTD